MRSELLLSGLLLVATSVAGQVYKYTDPSGRVIYSDKPQPGSGPTVGQSVSPAAPAPAATATPAAPAATATPSAPAARSGNGAAFREIEGSWNVANVTIGGMPDFKSKLTGSTWSFADDELAMERRGGEKVRYRVRIDAGADPKAFELLPLVPPTEPGGVMIYGRDGERLRLSFMDNLGVRPSGFEPQSKQTIVTLVPRVAESGRTTGAALPDACEALRAAGVVDFLGPDTQADARHIANHSTQCRLTNPIGAITLVLLAAADRTALDKERERQQKEAAASPVRAVVRSEPQFGPSAFSVTAGDTITIVARKSDTLVTMMVELPTGAHGHARPFAQRVLAQF